MASFLLPTAAIITLLLLVLSPPSVAIVDVDGDTLQNGGYYFILPYSSSNNGGLILAPAKESSPCPLFITQDSSNSKGFPAKISAIFKIPYIDSTALPIELSFDKYLASCNRKLRLRWWVAPSDANDKSYVIVGTNEPFDPTYYFKVERAKTGKNVYNIKFCHTIGFEIFRVSARQCKDVSMLDDGKLGVTEDRPFPVVFEKYSPQIVSYV